MSTNSGRDGRCARCDHAKDGHARKSESKCKNKACRKQWEICQVGLHGEVTDNLRRICYKPCNCKEKYHPDKATGAVPLASHEYKIDHPGYRALPQEEEEEDEEEVLSPLSKQETTSSNAKPEIPLKKPKKTSSSKASSNKASSKTKIKPKSSSLSTQAKSVSSDSSEDPLSSSKRTIGDLMPGITDGLAQMEIASTPMNSMYGPVSTTPYTQGYTSATASSYGSKTSVPTTSSTPAQAARNVNIISYEVNGDTCWAFELNGKQITSWADEWDEMQTQNGGL